MKSNALVVGIVSRPKTTVSLLVASLAFLIASPLSGAEHRNEPDRGRPIIVDRSSHGSIRHLDTHIVRRPVEVRHAPEHNGIYYQPVFVNGVTQYETFLP